MSIPVGSPNRSSLTHRVRYAARHPQRIAPYLRRLSRDWRIHRRTGGDHVAYYRAVMKADTAANPRGAVGTPTEERWNVLGQMQFDYPVSHGLDPADRMLEIGCGYLEPGHYHGIDISPDILLAAQQTVAGHGLQARLPDLTLVNDLRLAHLPDAHFDIVFRPAGPGPTHGPTKTSCSPQPP